MKVHYWLEREDAGVSVAAIALLNVTNFQHDLDPAITLSWTLGELPYRQFSGVRQQNLVLNGVSGMQKRLGYDRRGGRLFADGPSLYREFESFIRDYLNAATAAQAAGRQDVRMVLRAVFEKHDLYVEPGALQTRRSSDRSRHSYEWVLPLTAYGVARSRAPGPLGTVAEAAKVATAAVDTAIGYVALAEEYLNELEDSLLQFREPIRSVARGAGLVSDMAGSVRGIAGVPADLLRNLFWTASRGAEAIADLVASASFQDATMRRFADRALADIGEVRRSALEALGVSGEGMGTDQDDGSLGFIGHGSSALETSTRTEVVRLGDTWVTIAARALGDASRWTELALLNGSSWVGLGPRGAPLVPGSEVLVPVLSSELSSEGDLYGEDLRIGSDGDLVWSGDADVAMVRGKDNLVQAIRLRMTSMAGRRPSWPLYGLSADIGGPITATTMGAIASRFRSQVLADPRVAEVESLEVVDQGDALVVHSGLRAVGGSTFRLSVPVGT